GRGGNTIGRQVFDFPLAHERIQRNERFRTCRDACTDNGRRPCVRATAAAGRTTQAGAARTAAARDHAAARRATQAGAARTAAARDRAAARYAAAAAAAGAVPGGREDRLLHAAGRVPAVGGRQGGAHACERAHAEETDRERRQAEEARGGSAEAADQWQHAQRRGARAAREGYREAAGRHAAFP